jgi:hypothetical protein
MRNIFTASLGARGCSIVGVSYRTSFTSLTVDAPSWLSDRAVAELVATQAAGLLVANSLDNVDDM